MKLFRLLLASLILLATLASAQHNSLTQKDPEGHYWWQHAVFYELYPRSFADSNNDGIGDLNGIASKLDYLKSLGVDAIWMTPCFPSPQVDYGYDVSDYQAIAPEYGTIADFEKLQTEANKRGIKIILDYVINHTSDKHKWFLESASSKDNPKRDWYVWRDGRGMGQPPNNWTSTFGGSAWKFDPKSNQYYYHYFYTEQPDLNWRNPQVEKAMFDMARWWFNKGVAGFRLDAVDTMYEDPKLTDNALDDDKKNAYGDPVEIETYNKKLPEVHTALQRLRKVADDAGGRVLIGETWTKNIDELNEYYGPSNNEIQMPMDFLFTRVDKLSPTEFRKQIAFADSAHGWPVWVMSNHDIVRSINRYSPEGADKDQIAKLLGGMMLTLRGTPIMYYGEELAMVNNDPKRVEDVHDPIGKRGWPKEKGRDGERTPMQWNASTNAGFSSATPWLPVPDTYQTHNVATEDKQPDSVLNFYRKLIALRRTNPQLHEGKYIALNQDDPSVLSYLRQYKGKSVLVALNMTGSPQTVKLDLSGSGGGTSANLLLSSNPQAAKTTKLSQVTLAPYEAYVAEVK